MEAQPSRSYRVLEVLGSGGFGTVYRAEMRTPAGLRREVALKVLRPETASEEAARRLRDEARMLSGLHCAGIVRVDDLLQLEGRWTMVMELVDGMDVEKLLQHHGPLPVTVALGVIEQAARAVWQVYTAPGPGGRPLDLIHRDVKPANLLVDRNGVVKILDFGVARAELDEREAKTQAAIVMGSLPYLAPERYAFEDRHAGDVYGLGCVLYEMLQGKRFGRTKASPAAHVDKLRHGLHGLWNQLPDSGREATLELLGQCLAYEADARPTAEEVSLRAGEIRRGITGPTLQSWARQRVPASLARRQVEPDPLCGQVLTESLSGETLEIRVPDPPPPPKAPPTPPEPARRAGSSPHRSPPVVPESAPEAEEEPGFRWPLWIAGSVAGLVLLGLMGVALAEVLGGEPEPVAPVVAEEIEGPFPEPADELEDIVFQTPDALETERLEPPPPRPRPRPRQTQPEPEPVVEEQAEPTATLKVSGDAEFVRLVGADGSHTPGAVPPGVYTIFPSFAGGYTIKGPTVSVAPGDRVTFLCLSAEKRCVRE